MGKRAKRIIEKIPTKKKKIKRYFFKNLLSILPLVILLVVSVNIFIFIFHLWMVLFFFTICLVAEIL
jgi:hypothetical protein